MDGRVTGKAQDITCNGRRQTRVGMYSLIPLCKTEVLWNYVRLYKNKIPDRKKKTKQGKGKERITMVTYRPEYMEEKAKISVCSSPPL